MAKRKSAKKPDVNQRINDLESRMEELIDALEDRIDTIGDVYSAKPDLIATMIRWRREFDELQEVMAATIVQLTRHEEAWQEQIKLSQFDGQMQLKLATAIDDNNDTAIAEVGALSSRIAALEQIAEKLKTLFPMTLSDNTFVAESLEAYDPRLFGKWKSYRRKHLGTMD